MSDATQDASADQPADGAAPTNSVNNSRRYFLIGATSAVAGVGVVGAAIPFVQFWNPSAKAKALGAPVTVDISKLAIGEMMTVSWRGKPVFILNRDGNAVSQLENSDLDLADKDSEKPMQPDYAANPTRSSKPEIGIYVGICTHLGCSPKLVEAIDTFPDGVGGFFCPCHGSSFDLAGRVSAGVPAPDNLEVPPHRYDTDTVITIGLEA